MSRSLDDARDAEHAVGQRRLAVVDVGDDAEVADGAGLGRGGLECTGVLGGSHGPQGVTGGGAAILPRRGRDRPGRRRRPLCDAALVADAAHAARLSATPRRSSREAESGRQRVGRAERVTRRGAGRSRCSREGARGEHVGAAVMTHALECHARRRASPPTRCRPISATARPRAAAATEHARRARRSDGRGKLRPARDLEPRPVTVAASRRRAARAGARSPGVAVVRATVGGRSGACVIAEPRSRTA